VNALRPDIGPDRAVVNAVCVSSFVEEYGPLAESNR
jgi:hypothetical protein